MFLILITLPTILFGSLIYYQTTEVFKEQAEENINARLEKNDENLVAILNTIENITSYMIYDESFRTFFTTPKQDVAKVREAENAIKGFFTFQIMSYKYIDSIKLVSTNQDNLLNFGNPVEGNENELRKLAISTGGEPVWSNTYKLNSAWSGEHHVISLTRQINDINKISQPIGMARIRLNETELYKNIEVDMTQQGNYFVLSNSGEVVLHPDSDLVGNKYPNQAIIDLVTHEQGGKNFTYETGGEKYLLVKQKITGTNWFSVILVNQDEVVQNLYNVRTLMINLVVLLAVLGVVAFFGFYNWHVKPILELTEQTKQLEKGNFSAKVPVHSKDEIGRLGLRFNKMVITIQKFIDREYKLKIKQKESELEALQNQIDPHFLYNTLDMIRWTARMEKAMETSQLIERLSKIFRMNLNKGSMWVSLKEELVYLDNYLELQRSRMGDRLQYTIYYEEQLKDTLIVKQLIQPLVENSILHGLKDLPRQGKIDIRAYKRERSLIIDVIDNGRGFQEESLSKIDGGYALQNIRDRMRLAFGEGYGMEIKKGNKGGMDNIRASINTGKGKSKKTRTR
ncbi:histidine kinase [Gracilibacillus sp. JCM 18860]|uniref:histidine kinase n=1 Tax=Gracilibacillus sp. JCM 18860 TaxID=1306159 RepID=UPI0006D28854